MRSGEPTEHRSADDPPNSRLFIVCSKSHTEDDFKNAFDKFGLIEEVWLVKDRQTGDPKGVCYIKYSKTSEAALAMEAMNGEVIADKHRSLKVMIASSKELGSRREENDERLLRLFIVVPRKMTEDEVREYFQKYGDIDYVNIVKDRETRESKGIAYVKYFKMSHAAIAYEECDKTFRAVFARPKDYPITPSDRYSHSGPGSYPNYNITERERATCSSGPGYMINNFSNPEGYNRVIATISSSVSLNTITQLFDIIPSMEFCRFMSDSRGYSQGYPIRKVLVQYVYPQAAAYAREKLNAFEYPPGHHVSVKPDSDYGERQERPERERSHGRFRDNREHFSGHTDYRSRSVRSDLDGHDMGRGGGSSNGLEALTKALAEATQIIQKAGLMPSGGASPLKSDTDADPSYCSVALPPQQPLAPSDTKTEERLFLVCQPNPPPYHALWDVFSRFGNLIEVYVLSGRSCGYANYASKESALKAIETLNDQEICRMRMKVMIAEPRKTGGEGARKRLRTDDN